jgi:hypothetical protein
MNNNNEAMLYSTRPLKLLLKIKRERAKMLLYSRKDHKVNVKTMDPDSVKTSQLHWLKNYKVNRAKFSLIATRCNSEMHWHCRLTSYKACCLYISLYIRSPQSLGLYVCMTDIFLNEIWAQDKIYILASTLFVWNILLMNLLVVPVLTEL